LKDRVMAHAFTVRLRSETLAALDQLANGTGRSRSWLVARAIEDYAAINEWQLPKIEAGIEAADRGDFVSDEEMAVLWAKFSGR
jgi:predicted transcriptional regulator